MVFLWASPYCAKQVFSRKLNILIYHPTSLTFLGGGEKWILQMCPRLKEFGHKIIVITTQRNEKHVHARYGDILKRIDGAFEWFDLPVVRLPPQGAMISLRVWVTMFSLARWSDIIYFDFLPPSNELLMMLLKKSFPNKPIICNLRGSIFTDKRLRDAYMNTIGRIASRFCDAFHVRNRFSAKCLKKWAVKKIYLIPNGVNTRKFKFNRKKRSSKEFNVLFVGSLSHVKGAPILFKTIKHIFKDDQGIRFIFVGAGPLEKHLTKLVKECKNVEYLGFIREGLVDIYNSADLLVMPSRREQFPYVAIEAQACGLPVVASRIPGITDIVIDQVTGFLVRPGSYSSLVSGIKRCYFLWKNDQNMYSRMCSAAQRNVIEKFDLNHIAIRMNSMFLDVHNDAKENPKRDRIFD